MILNLISFNIKKGHYAFELETIEQVVKIPEIMPVPETPKHILGIANIRGEILPVFDIKMRIGSGKSKITDRAKLVIADIAQHRMALLVENIPGVLRVEEEEISADISELDIDIDKDFIVGIIHEKSIIILDISKIVA